MILDFVIAIVVTIMRPLFSVLPADSISNWFSGFDAVPNVATSLGQHAGSWDSVVPVVPMLSLIDVIAEKVVPAVLVYLLANWLYRHIPQIGGFGPGSG